MNTLNLIVGKPIKTSDERAEQIGIQEVSLSFGLDALALQLTARKHPHLLIPLGLLGVQ